MIRIEMIRIEEITNMKLSSFALLIGVIAVSMSPAASAAEPESASEGLVGTWYTQVTIRNCQTGTALNSFPALASFAPSGVVTDTTTGFPPLVRSPGHGSWEKTGANTYHSVSVAFLFSPTGAWTGTQKLTQTITIENNQYSSTAVNNIFDTSGTLTASGCASATATRVEVPE